MKKAKPRKKKKQDVSLEDLMRVTEELKKAKVKIVPVALPRAVNKWRSQDPKFSPKTEPTGPTVEAGGMKVDPSLKDEYDAWRREKEEEQKWRREQAFKRAEAERKARALLRERQKYESI